MTASIEVRAVRPDNYESWLPLWDGYNAFYKRVGPTALPKEVTQSTWSRFFDPYEPVNCLVATEGSGAIVGIVHYLFHRSTTMVQPTCYLQDLFTSEQARGKGVGRALILAVYDRAREARVSRIYWQTHESNTVAKGLYDVIADRTGFMLYRKDL